VPREWFTYLRPHPPIYKHAEPGGGPGFWVVTRYDDVVAINRDGQTLSLEQSRGHDDCVPAAAHRLRTRALTDIASISILRAPRDDISRWVCFCVSASRILAREVLREALRKLESSLARS
jgi:hypothetical protein